MLVCTVNTIIVMKSGRWCWYGEITILHLYFSLTIQSTRNIVRDSNLGPPACCQGATTPIFMVLELCCGFIPTCYDGSVFVYYDFLFVFYLLWSFSLDRIALLVMFPFLEVHQKVYNKVSKKQKQ